MVESKRLKYEKVESVNIRKCQNNKKCICLKGKEGLDPRSRCVSNQKKRIGFERRLETKIIRI